MATADLVIIGFLFLFALVGVLRGFVAMVGSLASLIFSIVAAAWFYEPASALVAPYVGGNGSLSKIIAFFGLITVVRLAFGLLFSLVNVTFKALSAIPFVKTANRLLGAILGLLEGVFLLGLFVYLALRYPVAQPLTDALKESVLVGPLLTVATLFAPLFPKAVQLLKVSLGPQA